MNLRPLLIGAIATCILALTAGLGLAYALHRVVADLPALPADPAELGLRPGTDIYAASGQRIHAFNQGRQSVPLADISPHVTAALIATEDADFYAHRGIDLKAIAGAARDNVLRGYRTRGGSTLTQQLVKRLFFSPDKSLARKLAEALLALQLEAQFAAAYPDTTPLGRP